MNKKYAPFVWSFGTALLVSGLWAQLQSNWQAWLGIILGLALMIYSGYFFLEREGRFSVITSIFEFGRKHDYF